MAIEAYPSRIALCREAERKGHVVSIEGNRTTIETGEITLSFSTTTEIVDAGGKVYTPKDAFDALDIKLG